MTAPARSNVFGALPTSKPFSEAQRDARQRVAQAQRRAPARPLPALPLLAHPTQRQVQTAKTLVRRAVQGQVPTNQPARARVQQLAQVGEELRSDPRTRPRLQVLDHYVAAEQDRQALAALRAVGVTGGTRSQRIRAGRTLLASLPRAEAKPGHLAQGVRGSLHRAGLSLDQRLFAQSPNLRLASVPVHVLRALVEHPGAIPKTATGAADLVVGAVAAPVELAIGTAVGAAHGHPLEAVNRFADQAKKDYGRRYGPLLEGNTAAFRKRIGEEGAASELADIATIAAPEGAILGRGLGRAARAGALGERAARFAGEARPRLMVAPGKAMAQELSPNLIRAAAQRAEDRLRQGRVERRNEKAIAKGDAVRGLQPQRATVVPLMQNRAMRKVAAAMSGRAHLSHRTEQVQEIDRGAKRSLGRLSANQRRAVFHVVQGLVTPDDPVRAREQLAARARQIEAHVRENAIPAQVPHLLKTNDELTAIRHLIKHADQVFTPKLAEFHAGEIARSHRVTAADPAVKNETAEVHRHRVQGEVLGIPREYERLRDAIDQREADLLARHPEHAEGIVHETEQARRVLEQRRPELDRQFVAQVRHAASESGLPEPGYVHHAGEPFYPRSDFTTGQGNRAIQGVHQSTLSLFRSGRADVTHDAYLQTLARGIKRKHNWKLTADMFQTYAEKHSPAQLRAILGRENVHADGLSIQDLKAVLRATGRNPRDWAFANPGRLYNAAHDAPEHAHLDELGGHDLEHAVHQAAIPATQAGDEFKATRGWYLIPRAAYDEITAGTKPSGAVGRGIGKFQGIQSRVLLASPSWLQMQVASEGGIAGIAMRGNLPDFIKAPLWYRRQPPQVRQALDEMLGASLYEGKPPKLGAATDARLVNFYRGLKDTRFAQLVGKANPLDAIFMADHAKGRAFRRAVLYNRLKRETYQQMGRDAGIAFRAQQQITHALSLGPKGMAELARNPEVIERHAQAVNQMLGDFTSYTARERRYMKRGLLFYGFLRYSTRLLFRTLPIGHPVAAAVAAKLGELHNDEVRDLLGGPQAPWAYSRVFFGSGDKLRSVDLARINPLTSPVVSLVQEGPKAALGLMSPVAQSLFDIAYGKRGFTGQPIRIHGSAGQGHPGLVDMGRIVANDLGDTAWAYRELKKTGIPGLIKPQIGTQGDDTLLGSARPIQYRTAPAQEREAQRREQAGTPLQQLQRDTFPLFFPKPDNTRQLVAARQKKARATASGGWGDAPAAGASSGTASGGWGD